MVSRIFYTPITTADLMNLPILEIRQFCEGTPLVTKYGVALGSRHLDVQAVADTDQFSSCRVYSTRNGKADIILQQYKLGRQLRIGDWVNQRLSLLLGISICSWVYPK